MLFEEFLEYECDALEDETDEEYIEKSDESTYYLNGNVKIDFSYMTIEELDDNDKVKWCRENCCGCDYCGGCKEDGSKCEYAPSIEIIKKEMGIN